MNDIADEINKVNEYQDIDHNETNCEENEEREMNTKDPIKKYQFKYNESLYMVDKYPEISIKTDSSVNIAPGEGQIPKDIMTDYEWDIKAFPHLHNTDGSNGKDQERVLRLTDKTTSYKKYVTERRDSQRVLLICMLR